MNPNLSNEYLKDRQIYKLSASILSADLTRLGDQVIEAELAGVDVFHVDVMDGHFVRNISFGPCIVHALRKITKRPLDVHLMITQPESQLDNFVTAGASGLIVHIEACSNPKQIVEKIKLLGCRAGVCLSPSTPISILEDIVKNIDIVLVAAVNPGYGGQKLQPDAINRIMQARELIDKLEARVELQVDGGINSETISRVRAAGADSVVVGSAIFNHNDSISEKVRNIKAQLE